MRVLHVLSGLHAAGIEALALQLISHSPPDVEAQLLNTNRQEQAAALDDLQRSGKLAALPQWRPCDGVALAWRSFWLCRQQPPLPGKMTPLHPEHFTHQGA